MLSIPLAIMMKEISKSGFVRDIKMDPRVEYRDTLHTERGEKQEIQSKPKGGI